MSAYMMDNEQLSSIAAGLFRFENTHYWNEKCAAFKSEAELAHALHTLNEAAMLQRYGHKVAGEIQTFRFVPCRSYSGLKLHKALSSLLYQCSEGSVPETRCYAWLESIKNQVADHLISKLDGWQNADGW